ncbi:hypothetical protein Efla_000748 [Eimeria flavescens]
MYFGGLFTNKRISPAALGLSVLLAVLTVIVVTVSCRRFTGTKTNAGPTERRLGANEDSDSSEGLESPLDPEVCADLLSSPPSLEGPTAGGPPASFAQDNTVAAQKRGREEDEEESDEVQRANKFRLSSSSSEEDASKGSEEASSTVDGSAEFPPHEIIEGGTATKLEETVGAGSPSSTSAADNWATVAKSGTASAVDERPPRLSKQLRSSSSSPSSPEASPSTSHLSPSQNTEALPSTTIDPEQRRPDPSPRPLAQDPLYRVPALQANIVVMPVDYFRLQPDAHPRTLFRALHMIRNLLMKPLLFEADVQLLRMKLANLFHFCRRSMPEISSGCTDRKLVYGLAVRFLTLDAAWACSEALGPSMDREAWWGAFSSDVVGSSLEARSKSELRHSGIGFLALTNGLREALRKYRQGTRHSAEEALGLKKELQKGLPSSFQKKGMGSVQTRLMRWRGTHLMQGFKAPSAGKMHS